MFNKNTVKGLEGDVHYRSGTSDHNDTRIFEEEFYTNNNGVLSNSEFLKLLWIIFSSDSLTFINEHQLCLILELKVGILKWNPWWVKPTSVNDWLELHVGPTSADWMSVPVNTCFSINMVTKKKKILSAFPGLCFYGWAAVSQEHVALLVIKNLEKWLKWWEMISSPHFTGLE